MYHMNQIKKGSACTPQGIVSTFDGYEKALKNTLLNKFAIETPDNKIQEVTSWHYYGLCLNLQLKEV